jgi:hypothetical protein
MLQRRVFTNKIKILTTKAEEYYRPRQHTSAHEVSGLPALIRATVIFVIVLRFRYQLVQLAVYLRL